MLERKIDRRTFLKKMYHFWFTLLWLSSLGYIYSRYIEPKQLKTTFHTLISDKIPPSFHDVRIVQFSDTHLGHYYNLNQLQALVEEINKHNPHIVLFTGDLIDAPDKYQHADKIPSILKGIHASVGKYAIYGNHDHGGYGSNLYKKTISNSGFTLLRNNAVHITTNKNEAITIAGMDDTILGKPSKKQTFQDVPTGNYTLLLVHEPDPIDDYNSYPFDIQLSGHSHGGQVKLPFFPPLITPPGAKKYYEGFYTIAGVKRRLYVNRGIGTTRLPYRFMSVPELTVFTLKTKRIT